MTRTLRSVSRRVPVVAVLMCVLGMAAACSAAPPAPGLNPATACTSHEKEACRGRFPIAPGADVRYYANYPLTGTAKITHAVVVVHGIERNAHAYYLSALDAATAAGAADSTVVVAPDFQTAADDPGAADARWTSSGWRDGDGAVSPGGLSSFAVMDEMLVTLADRARFPHLSRITVVGHSAGAQYVEHYAAASRVPDTLGGLPVNYVVANPSIYLYLSPLRPDPADPAGQRFAVPDSTCPYNRYRYGLDRPNAYVGNVSPARIIQQYTGRRITYLLGSADTYDNGDEDTSCAAELQGNSRFQRGQLFLNYLRQYFPNSSRVQVVVPGVAHDNKKMFGSPQGQAAIFSPPGP
jgi:hypothetical protein